MPKIALNFICKNESHIVTRMLASVRPIIDLIVAVDTGSTDNTVEIIKDFGRRSGIPVYVFQRQFDNFCNSRNHALDKLREVIALVDWSPSITWGCFIDCDEILIVHPSFQKFLLEKDIYTLTIHGDGSAGTRQFLFSMAAAIRWEGPIHELLIPLNGELNVQYCPHLSIRFEPKGASWKGDLESKYLNYAQLLKDYVSEGHERLRWLYYTGDSLMTAAEYCNNKARKRELRLEAKQYYDRAYKAPEETFEEKIALYNKMADNRIALEEEWSSTQELLLRTYCLDIRKAESIAKILTYYMNTARWETAYMFSSFLYRIYHGHPPLAADISYAELDLYRWKFLLYHAICSFQTGRRQEAHKMRMLLDMIIRANPGDFTFENQMLIRLNSGFYITLRKWNPWAQKQMY